MYDACFISFSSPDNDARTLNLARAAASFDKKTCLIALNNGNAENNITTYPLKISILKDTNDIDYYPIRIGNYRRMMLRWWDFFQKSRKFEGISKAKHYFAMDLYSLPSCIKLKEKFGGKVYYDSREIYSALGPLYKNPLKQKILSRIEKKYVKNVDGMIVSGELDAEYLREYFGHGVPYHVIMNLPPYKEKTNSNLIREKFGLAPATKIILYQGMLLPGRGLEKTIEAMKYLDDYSFVIFGEGVYKEILESFVKNLGLENKIIFAGNVKYDQLHDWTSSADLGISLIEPISFSYELALPNKIFEYCMARIPILASNLPAMKHIIEIYSLGVCVENGIAPKDLASKIEEMILKSDKFILNCELASRELCYENQMSKVKEMFDEGK